MRTRVMSVVVAAMWTVGVAAQSAPNFSGTWTLDRDKTAAASPPPASGNAGGGRVSAGGGMVSGAVGAASAATEWVITQTSAALTLTRAVVADGSTQKLVYKLDGSESVNVNGRTTQTTKTTVAAGKITTTGTQTVKTDQGDITSEIKEVRSLDKDGAMVVETTRTFGDSGSRTTTQVYVKKK
jgi:hypothetical protein